MAAIHGQHPDAELVLLEETRGGGIDGPWVFRINAVPEIEGLGPALVMHGSSTVEFIPDVPGPLRLAVQSWEKQTYGSLQR